MSLGLFVITELTQYHMWSSSQKVNLRPASDRVYQAYLALFAVRIWQEAQKLSAPDPDNKQEFVEICYSS